MSDVDKLLGGFRAFRETYFERRPDLFEPLARKGQNPRILVVACSDSRVDPAILFDAEPGEMFVVRNVANIVPPYEPDGHYHGTSAAVEFAVRDLAVEHIVVLGHSSCGGVGAMCAERHGSPVEREFIGPWISLAAAAQDADPYADRRSLEQAVVRLSIANLHGFPWIAERVAAGKLSLHGWWFDLAAGALWQLDEATGTFDPITPIPAQQA